MGRYIIRRLLRAIPLLFFVSLFLFILLQNMGDPLATMGGRQETRPKDRERLTRQLGLDKPIFVQYIYWLVGNDWTKVDVDGDGVAETPGRREGALRLDFGRSLVTKRPAWDDIWDRIPKTLMLMIPAQIVITLVALIVGIYSALHQYSMLDNIVTTFSFIGLAMPIFFIALLSAHIFAVRFQDWGLPHLPPNGMFDEQVGQTPYQIFIHMILPVFSIAFISIAGYSRYIRGSMLEVINEDYIRTARAKGLDSRYILFTHALKNASLPIVTLVGLDLPFLLAGAVVTESIFAWPGMGRLFIERLNRFDTPVVMGILLLLAVSVVIFQILTDITYAVLDPRIRYD